jgi:hypothetical protein
MRSFMQAFVDLGHLKVANKPGFHTGSQVMIRRIITSNLSRPGDVPVGKRSRVRSLFKPEGKETYKEIDTYVDTTFANKFAIVKPITILKVDVEGAEWDAFGGSLAFITGMSFISYTLFDLCSNALHGCDG